MSNLLVKKKRGRPKGWRKVVGRKDRFIMFRMTEELYNILLNESIAAGLTMSEIIRQCIEDKFKE